MLSQDLLSQQADPFVRDFDFPEGRTIVAFKAHKNEFIVGGSQGTGLKVYKDTDNVTPPIEIPEHTEDITAIVTMENGQYISAGTDGNVIIYSKSNRLERIIVRSTTAVRALSLHPNQIKLAIATDDGVIRILLLSDSSNIIQLQSNNDSTPLKSIAYDCKGDRIVASNTKGDIRIWDVSEHVPAPKVISELKGVTADSNDVDSLDVLATVAYNPDNTCFAFPGRDREVCVFSSGTWKLAYNFENEHLSNVVTVAWSPNGYYLASTDGDGLILVWDVKSKTKVATESSSAPVYSIAWSQVDNMIVYTDINGDIRYWKNVISIDNGKYSHPAEMRKPPVVKQERARQETSSKQEKSIKSVKQEKQVSAPQQKEKKKFDLSSLMEDEAIDDDDDLDDDEKELAEVLGEDLDMMDDDEEDEEGNMEDLDAEAGDFVVDDDGAGYVEDRQAEPVRRMQQQLGFQQNQHIKKVTQKIESVLEPPISFQPNETPYHKPEANKSFDPANGERRYMAYNLLGCISTIFEEGHSIVNVEYHDQTEHRNFHFTDLQNFSMGALSAAGTVFAVESKEATKKPKERNFLDSDDEDEEEEEEAAAVNSTLHFRPIKTTDKDWTIQMLSGEDIVNVAVNRASVIISTSLGYIRIFTTSGVQKFVFSLENVVSVTAMNDLAFIAYSNGPAYNNQQNLSYVLLNTETNDIIQKDFIHLSTESELNWVGFTETNQAVTYDSASVLRVLHRQRRPYQGSWVPVFDGKRHAQQIEKTEKYWPVGVLRDRLMCVILRGTNTYPYFPPPKPNDIALQLPLLSIETEVGQLEEEALRIDVRNLHERDEAEATGTEAEFGDTFRTADTDIDVAILKLINLACKAEKVTRALDLTYILHSAQAIDRAIKIAVFHRYNGLAENMSKIKELKFSEIDMITPSTLADSLAAMPSIHESTHDTLDSNLAFVKPENSTTNGTNKRTLFGNDDDSQMSDVPSTKKARPFQFST